MDIYDKSGRLIIPEPERLRALGITKGVIPAEKKILVSQLFCPNGHALITPDNPRFDSQPGIKLLCEGRDHSEIVYLSPFQGDMRKKYEKGFGDGEILKIYCPVCRTEFPKLAPHDCMEGAMYIALFLDKEADVNNAACICNAWGCYSSFLRLSGEIISEYRYQFHLK